MVPKQREPRTPELSEEALQGRLGDAWPMMTWGDTGDVPRTIVVLHTVAEYIPPSWYPLIPAYEERFLCYLLALAAPGTRVVYVTSMPVLPRLLDYWFGLVPGLDQPEVRQRLTLVPVVDDRPISLTRKVLEHPGVQQRIREAIPDPRWAVIVGHTVTEDDLRLARRLGVPAYGPTPATAEWGTKAGSRRAFAESGVACAPGVTAVRSRDDVAVAIERLTAEVPGLSKVIVKHDYGVSGIGNGPIRVDDLRRGAPTRRLVDRIVLEEASVSVDAYYDELAREGGVVEAYLEADEVSSPSAQLRIGPHGEAELISTHEQLLGGPNGLTYEGCAMPASPAYATAIGADGLAVARRLAKEGIVGRFAIDFLACRRGSSWTTYGLEINLRNGGTTHPMATLNGLCGGGYDAGSGRFLAADGTPKFYRATDHVADPSYARLTTHDVLGLFERDGLGWDSETQTGTVVHMASAIAATGIIGLVSIADDPAGAEAAYHGARSALAEAADHLVKRVQSFRP